MQLFGYTTAARLYSASGYAQGEYQRNPAPSQHLMAIRTSFAHGNHNPDRLAMAPGNIESSVRRVTGYCTLMCLPSRIDLGRKGERCYARLGHAASREDRYDNPHRAWAMHSAERHVDLYGTFPIGLLP